MIVREREAMCNCGLEQKAIEFCLEGRKSFAMSQLNKNPNPIQSA